MRSLGFANKADRNRPPDVANRGPDGKFAAGSLMTCRWREMDSNLQYRAVKGKFVPSASGSSRLQSRMWGRENRCSQVREAVISFPSHSALLRLRRAMSRWRSGPQGWVGAIAALKFPPLAPASRRYAQVIAVMHRHLGAGAVMVQLSSSAPRTTPSSQAGARFERVVACCAARRLRRTGGTTQIYPRSPSAGLAIR